MKVAAMKFHAYHDGQYRTFDEYKLYPGGTWATFETEDGKFGISIDLIAKSKSEAAGEYANMLNRKIEHNLVTARQYLDHVEHWSSALFEFSRL